MSAFVSPVLPGYSTWCILPCTTLTRNPYLRPLRPQYNRKRATILSIAPTASEPRKIVDNLLSSIEGTDIGIKVSQSQRKEIDKMIMDLTEIGKDQKPMEDERLFSNYTVAYTSQKGKSPPAGGLFRSKIGRLLFRTRGLFQHVLKPRRVINVVCFRMFGIFSGNVCLSGELEAIADDEIGPNGIAIAFGRPRLRIGRAVFEFGPRSRVRIRTTYLDDRVRIAVGGSGSLFVFAKGGQANSKLADEWMKIFSTKPLPTSLLPAMGFAAILSTFWAPIPIRIAAFVVGTLLTFVLRRGGTDKGPNVLPEN